MQEILINSVPAPAMASLSFLFTDMGVQSCNLQKCHVDTAYQVYTCSSRLYFGVLQGILNSSMYKAAEVLQ